MTPEEIRNIPAGAETSQSEWLREIAAQLAEMNETLCELSENLREINEFGIDVHKG